MKRINPTMVPSEPPEEPPAGKMITAKVFAVFASAWPRHEVSEPELNLWAHQIGHLPEVVALEAATTLTRTSEWWPSIRRFMDEATAIQRRRNMRENVAALPEGRDLELGKAKVAEIREQIAVSKNHRTKESRNDG